MTSYKKQTILLVDDGPNNLDVLRGILESDYEIQAAINGQIALKIAANSLPDLILLDVMMPGMDGFEVCKRLKANPQTEQIPVIFVTAMLATEDEEKGFNVGAVDYITKPVNPSKVNARVKTHLALANQKRACQELVEQQTKELVVNQKSAIYMLGEAGHYNDTDTGVHIWRMAAYGGALARALNWSVNDAELLKMAAPMHDTGKIGIPDSILKAPRKLTDKEWQIMKTHSEIGHKILSQSKTEIFRLAADIALYHHEKWDGNGYPKGLKGMDIPASARIVAIADVFDALTTKRPYKEPWSIEQAMDLIASESSKHFDPQMVEAFIAIKHEIFELKNQWESKTEPTLF